MTPKAFVKRLVKDAGDVGLRLDVILDKANRRFPDKVITSEFIIETLAGDKDVEMFFKPYNTRTAYWFRKAPRDPSV